MDFRILGSLEVRDGGRPLRLTGTKQRALLTLLLLHANQVVSGDRLLDKLRARDFRKPGSTLSTVASRSFGRRSARRRAGAS